MLVTAPVQTDKTIQSIEEIIREYNEYLSDRPAEETELEKIIKGRSLALIGEFETFGALMSGLANIVKFNRPDDFLETYLKNTKRLKSLMLIPLLRHTSDLKNGLG